MQSRKNSGSYLNKHPGNYPIHGSHTDYLSPLYFLKQLAHGYDPQDPLMHGSLVVWGAGVRSGVKLPVVRSVDVAPTMARLLGLRMKNVDGRVLDEVLTNSPR